jgi:hypothetical protein
MDVGNHNHTVMILLPVSYFRKSTANLAAWHSLLSRDSVKE